MKNRIFIIMNSKSEKHQKKNKNKVMVLNCLSLVYQEIL